MDWHGLHGSEFVESYLYDNDADPHQKNNRVTDPQLADIRTELFGRLKQRMLDANEPEPVLKT